MMTDLDYFNRRRKAYEFAQTITSRFIAKAFGGIVINDVLYVPEARGCRKYYKDGTIHFISNSWYSDINTDQL